MESRNLRVKKHQCQKAMQYIYIYIPSKFPRVDPLRRLVYFEDAPSTFIIFAIYVKKKQPDTITVQ